MGGWQPGSGPASSPGPDRRRSWPKIAGTALALAVLMAGAAGGTWVYVRHQHGRGQVGVAKVSQSVTSPPDTPSTGSGSSADPSPSDTSQTLQITAAAAANPVEPQVGQLVTAYFDAINNHDFSGYVDLMLPSLRPNFTESSFTAGYSSTVDTNMVLTDISGPDATGEVGASLTFTSNQDPSQSPDGSSCDNWQITLYLQPAGSAYLIGGAPAGYQASYGPC